SLGLTHFDLAVSTAFEAKADGVQITYDPSNTDAHQQLVEIDAGTISVPKLDMSGSLSNLFIYKDGFSFGALSVTKDAVKVGKFVTADALTVTLKDFGITYGQAVTFNGSIGVTAKSASAKFGNLSATIHEGASHDGKGLSATFQFENNDLD